MQRLFILIGFCFIFFGAILPSFGGVGGGSPLFYGSMEQSDAWYNTRASGFYSFAADGRGFTPVGEINPKEITVTDGAVYHGGKVYYLRKTVESLFRYSLDWTVMDARTFKVESRTAKNGLTLAFDMTYDETTQTCFAASPRTYGANTADLRRVDLATGDFETIAELSVCVRAITADSKGQLWGLGNEVIDGRTTTFLYKINKESGELTRIGDVGYQMQETDASLTCDLRNDRIYWGASTYTDDEYYQRTYRRGLCEIDTETGRATFLWDFPNNEKMVGVFINTDYPEGFSNPTPLPVSDVQLTPLHSAATARLTWTAPTACEDRITPLDPDALTYTVTRRNDGRIVASGLKECCFEDTPDFAMQRVGYTVTAVTPDGQSEAVQSPLYAIGQPRQLPYLQTFDSYNSFYTFTLWDANGDMNPEEGNGWFYDFDSQAALYFTTLSRPADDWLISPTLSFDPSHVYRIRFGTYGYMGEGAVNTFEVALMGQYPGADFTQRTVLSDSYDTHATSPAFNVSANPRWYSVVVQPADGEDRIGFHNISSRDDHMFIDNIYIEDLGPADEYDDKDEGDEPGDDDLETYDDDVLRYVDDLSLNGDGALTWSAATKLPRLRPSLQDCEGLEPFSIDGGEGWTTHDADGARTLGIGTNQGMLEWPHATEAQAFIVYDTDAMNTQSFIPTHSGKQCFISFAAAGRANDDWLISPLLSGQKSVVKFWAKCLYPECLNEEFEVWGSYDAPQAEALTESAFRIAGPVTVGSQTEWTEYRFVLPEGVRYVMLRCTSDSQFGLMIDDISFPAAPAPTEFWGYNVYCDGVCVARELPTTSFVPSTPGRYTVAAQYAEGESRLSNAVDVTIEGIASPLLPAFPSSLPSYHLDGRQHGRQHGIIIQGGRKRYETKRKK